MVKDDPYILDTVFFKLIHVSNLIKRNIQFTSTSGSALTISRSQNFSTIKQNILSNSDNPSDAYVLLMDSDLGIDNSPQELADVFLEAEKNDYNIIGHYKKRDFSSTLLDRTTHNVLDNDTVNSLMKEKYVSMNNYYYPIGFYYGRLNLDYKFRMDMKGEDINFIEDNKNMLDNKTFLDTRIKLSHYKLVAIC